MGLKIEGHRARRVVVLAGPVVIAMLTQTLINVVDTMFVGQLDPSISTPGQAALGYSLPLLWAVGGSLSALGVGTQAMSARRAGADDQAGAGRVLANSLVVAALAATAMMIFAWMIVPHAFSFLTQNEAVAALGVPYARVRILGVLSMVATASLKGFFDGLGETKVHMWAAIVMNIANIALNYTLIFGLGPIPAYHVTGAALASLISTYIGLAVMFGWAMRAKFKDYQIFKLSQLDGKTAWGLITLSTPGGMAQVFIMAGVLMFLKIIGALDDQVVLRDLSALALDGAPWQAATALGDTVRQLPGLGAPLLLSDWGQTALVSRPPVFTTAAKLIIDLMSLAFVTCIAFGTATATLISQAMGAGDMDEAEGVGWDSIKLGMILYGALGALAMISPQPLLSLLSQDPVVWQVAEPGLQLMGGLQMFVAMALILTQALFGAGDTKFVMIVELILHVVCLAPLAYLLAIHLELGFLGVWMSAATYLTLLASAMAVKFWHGGWKHIEV